MTYFELLEWLIVPPLMLLGLLALRDEQGRRELPPALRSVAWPVALGGVAVAAVVYATLWVNFLVAGGVRHFDTMLVSGWLIGWVPLEEYLFLVLATLLTGLWLIWLLRRLPPNPSPSGARRVRLAAVAVLAVPWLGSLWALTAGDRSGTYLAALLAWALPPLMLLVGVGADILWSYRRALLATLVPLVLYLALVDGLALAGGTWTIARGQTLSMDLGGRLPVEELVFFAATVTLVACGETLLLSVAAKERLRRRLRAERS